MAQTMAGFDALFQPANQATRSPLPWLPSDLDAYAKIASAGQASGESDYR